MNSVELVGYYGSDESHAASAWTSTSREITPEKAARIPELLRFLAEHGHHTPFEKSTLHFLVTAETASHIHLLKHRIGVSCLAADTEIVFENCEGDPSRRWTIGELWKKWNKGRRHQNTHADMLYQRDRIKRMRLRTLNTHKTEIAHTQIKDIMFQGERPVFVFRLEDGEELAATEDHRVYTERGWMPIAAALDRQVPVAVQSHVRDPWETPPESPPVDETTEQWKAIPNHSGYEISSQGRVRSYYENRHLRPYPVKIKEQVLSRSNYKVVSLHGKAFQVHRLVALTFLGDPPGEQMQVRHLNNNPLDNRVENLAWGTAADNHADWYRDLGHARLRIVFRRIVGKKFRGVEPVFDLEVGGEHNFIANGVVVHNCNGESARYKELKDDKAHIPGDWPQLHQDILRLHIEECFDRYHKMLEDLTPILGRKRAKESARFFLPYANQIVLDVSFNFRSFMHFQDLRNAEDAQLEIREIAESMLELVRMTGEFEYSLKAFGY